MITKHNGTIAFIAAGAFSSYYLNSEGVLYAWGRNDYAQLGQVNTTVQYYSPTLVNFGNSNVVNKGITKICGGQQYAIIRTASNNLYYWVSINT